MRAVLENIGMTPNEASVYISLLDRLATVKNQVDIVKLLLEAKADVNAKVFKGEEIYTPISFAKQMGHSQTIELLEKYGAKQ